MSNRRIQRVSKLVKEQVSEIVQELSLGDAGFVSIGNRPDDLAAHMRREVDKFTQLVRQIGLRPE